MAAQVTPGAEALLAALKAVQDAGVARSSVVKLENGVELEIMPVPVMRLRQAGAAIAIPLPPKVYDQDRDRDEENPDDPGYQDALRRYNVALFEATVHLALLLGTRVKTVPEDLSGPEEEGWVQQLRAAGVDVDCSNQYTRYRTWLEEYAIRTEDELSTVYWSVMSKSGVLEKEVAAAAASFRNRAARRADKRTAGKAAGNGHNGSSGAPGPGAGVRGETSGPV